jgi:hypothetical protein
VNRFTLPFVGLFGMILILVWVATHALGTGFHCVADFLEKILNAISLRIEKECPR